MQRKTPRTPVHGAGKSQEGGAIAERSEAIKAGERWAPRPAPDAPEGLILFDGVCVFCSRWVRWVIARDREAGFRFTAIQSATGKALAEAQGVDLVAPQTNAVTRDGRIHFKSDAVLAVVTLLPGWRWVGVFRRVPRGLRDALYDRVARNRYRLFGRSETCLVPTPGERSRFVD